MSDPSGRESSPAYTDGQRVEWHYSVMEARFPREWLPAIVLRADRLAGGFRFLSIALVDESGQPKMGTATALALNDDGTLRHPEQVRTR